MTLLGELGVGYTEFLAGVTYSGAGLENVSARVDATILLLRRNYVKNRHGGMTFKRYAVGTLGRDAYMRFVERMGFSDFEAESAHDVLEYYGLEDNTGGWVGMSIDWALVVARLADKVGRRRIRTNAEVVRVDLDHGNVHVHVLGDSVTYASKQVVVASTVETVRRLLPQYAIFRDIRGQSFMRVYTKFGAPIPGVDTGTTTVVPGPLKKIAPVDVGAGVYLVAYTDNADADSLHAHSRNNATNRAYFSKLIAESLGLRADVDLKLEAIKAFYWKIGTHYYAPLAKRFKTRQAFIRQAQRPHPNVRVVGEMVALHQGWTRGALESVDSIARDWNRN
ncbi:hypothetical protein FOA52_005429 [Chlamydomonas sp. UWO 241]|nr:hypothetical protein FOA52_005429 [Chlamydomonas sp. UWO 241]